jgi:hypothetical protein
VFHAKKEPTAQIAHLLFANTLASPKKKQKSYFLPPLTKNNEN